MIAAPLTAGMAATVAGGCWGGIAGWLRAQRGAHEVITTIMLNFIAAGLASYVTLGWLKNAETQNPETRSIGAHYLLPQFSFFDGAPVSLALPLALLLAFFVWIFLWRTARGFELRAVGQNELAAQTAGIEIKHSYLLSMVIAGALAGLVGVVEVLGNSAGSGSAFLRNTDSSVLQWHCSAGTIR